ncbi:uncharacterized protein LOC107625067 isoform X3 [Arachis ipaensis]|uniref:uncharacterized protein LOC107625067 isoform X3 n=1 Tax=Arachis ipaensis TaxID=130454 RepID=UPI000A2B3B65|nr:uncharacterized protein LOC107625067 isoform X3 [Arachis ipaensis]
MTNNRRCGLLKLVSLRNASHSFSNAKPDSHLAATLTAKKSVSGFHTNIDDAVAFFIRLINEHRTPSQLELGRIWGSSKYVFPCFEVCESPLITTVSNALYSSNIMPRNAKSW